MNNFKTIVDIATYFSNEDKARDWLEKRRWPDGRIVCPLCGVRDAYRNSDMVSYKCRDQHCKARFTVTKGTWFENTKLPLSKWFMAIYIASAHKKGISSCQLARDLGIGQKAAWFVLHRVREMLKDGQNFFAQGTVAVDEAHIGGRQTVKKTFCI